MTTFTLKMTFLKVCGLKWSPDNQHLASGGNDNKLFVWNSRAVAPLQTYSEHMAAVKAIAWSPHQHGLLASGGGTADRRIRFWNTITGRPLQCIDTGSQVCNLAWSKHSSELVSCLTLCFCLFQISCLFLWSVFVMWYWLATGGASIVHLADYQLTIRFGLGATGILGDSRWVAECQ